MMTSTHSDENLNPQIENGSSAEKKTSPEKPRRSLQKPESTSVPSNGLEVPPSPSSPRKPTAYHPSIMFCGDCTTCIPVGAGGPPPIMAQATTFTTDFKLPKQKKRIAKMKFVKAGDLNIVTDDQQLELEMQTMNNTDVSESSTLAEKINTTIRIQNVTSESQLKVIDSILRKKNGVLGVRTYPKDQEKFNILDVEYDPLGTDFTSLLDTLKEFNWDAEVINQNNTDLERAQSIRKPRRSTLFVQGICCASEVPEVTSILRKLSSNGVEKVSINITSRLVYVDHYPDEITATDLEDALNKENFGATVKSDGGAKRRVTSSGQATSESRSPSSSTPMRKPRFVESTLECPFITEEDTYLIHEALDDLLLDGSIRFVSPNIPSRTVKVEHNPQLLSAENITEYLMNNAGYANVTVKVDGRAQGLYLPDRINMDMSVLDTKKSKWWCIKRVQQSLPQGLGLNIIISGIFWFVSVLGHFIEEWEYLQYFGLISVAFGIPSVTMKAFRTLRRYHFDANCMMVTAAFGSLCLGQFDEAASVSFLFAISEFLEDRATQRATKALDDIINMRPDHANLVIDEATDEIEIVNVNELDIGSIVIVRTGDQVPSDGIVIAGKSQIDESSLTGESVLVSKKEGDIVSGGTINAGASPLKIRTTSLVEDSAVSRLVRLVEESAANTSPTEQIVDSFARSYTPTVIVIAFFMCTIPWLISPEAGRRWTLNGLIIVVIACPCALTISTPVTYAAGLAATAQKGIIVKGGAKLEALGSVKTVVFDKTGTLTEGKFHLTHLDAVGGMKDRREVLSLLSTMEAPSSHPLAATLVNAAKAEGIEQSANAQVTDHTILHGEGVQAMVNGEQVYVGNVRLFERLGMYDALNVVDRRRAESWNEEGGTVGFLGLDGVGIVGMFCVSDVVRSEAASVVGSLMKDEVKVLMLTGDGEGAAISVAKRVGLDSSQVCSNCLPEDKVHFLKIEMGTKTGNTTNSSFGSKGNVLFVGDGVNDGPAIVTADVGVAMGEGAALAMEISDVTLMDSKLENITFCMSLGKKVVATVKQNIAFSILAKLIVIGFTFLGKMTLLGAIASDVGVMLLVSLNGMKLLP